MSTGTNEAFDLDRIGGPHALGALVDEVLACGELALAMRAGASARYEKKPDLSPVTEADRAVEGRLRSFIAKHHPGVGFIGEESGASDSEAVLRFLVDPIDGTRAFLRGIPTWSVLVGLEAKLGAAYEPVLGIAFMPAAGDLFVGVRGQGAQANGRPVRVSAVASVSDAVVTHGSLQQFRDGGQLDLLPKLVSVTYTQRGFADFDGYRQLLLGRVDAMIDPAVKGWDLCAPAVLVREAGGELSAFDGTRTIHGGGAIATNGAIHDALVHALR